MLCHNFNQVKLSASIGGHRREQDLGAVAIPEGGGIGAEVAFDIGALVVTRGAGPSAVGAAIDSPLVVAVIDAIAGDGPLAIRR